MIEEVRIRNRNRNGNGDGDGDGVDDERVMEWEDGLPGLADLAPLSQALIPPELLSAFRIAAELPRSSAEVSRASKSTVASIRCRYHLESHGGGEGKEIVVDDDDREVDVRVECLDSRDSKSVIGVGIGGGGGVDESESKIDRISSFDYDHSNNNSTLGGGVEEFDSKIDSISKSDHDHNSVSNVCVSISSEDIGSGKGSKRARLVWTPQLHKRFVDVVGHLGIKSAVPKTIMQMMNVEGLTRENVASHLQKYRLYLKRMQGLSDEGPSASDNLFASTPVPQSLHESGGGESVSGRGNGQHGHHQGNGSGNGNGHFGMPVPMPYPPPPPQMMHLPYIGMAMHGHGHVGVPSGSGYHGYDAHHQFNMMQNRFGSFPQYHNHVARSDN